MKNYKRITKVMILIDEARMELIFGDANENKYGSHMEGNQM